MTTFISTDLIHYLTRPLTEQEKEWRMDDHRYKKTLLPPLTKGPKKTDVAAKGPQKLELNTSAFLMKQSPVTLIRYNRCPDCGEKIICALFKTKNQHDEYNISGKCVKCQPLALPG
jgi:hypothetical protein